MLEVAVGVRREPARGVRIEPADILITAREIDRFEEAQGIGRSKQPGPRAPTKYDWDAFYSAVLKRRPPTPRYAI